LFSPLLASLPRTPCNTGFFLFFFWSNFTAANCRALSLHDALLIFRLRPSVPGPDGEAGRGRHRGALAGDLDRAEVGGSPSMASTDRKSTRLNSSHEWISYAVCCLKTKTNGAMSKLCGVCQ